ncbi:phosphatidylcholine/phosphatidylserine synthase [soil metagenome]
MMKDHIDEQRETTAAARAAAWGVHLYTATGALTGFAATLAVIAGDYRTAFLWLAAATFVDATDGMLARLAHVKARVPTFDGGRLDDIVDYLTYVFVPVLLLHHAGALPPGWGVAVASVVLLSSAYGFASEDAKSDDHFFTGFPSYWNIVAVYLLALGLPPMVNAGILLTFSILVFVRIGYIYPSRTPVLRGLTLGLGGLWALMVVAVILALPDPPMLLVIGSLYFPVYYTVLSFTLHARRSRRA